MSSGGETGRRPRIDDPRAGPSGWRLLIALLLAPIPPILLFAFFWRGDQEGSPGYVDGIFAGILGAYPLVLLVGLPLLIVLRHRARPTLRNAALTGAALASVPWWLIALFSADIGTVKNLALPATLLGLFGGLIFYWIGLYRKRT